MVLGKPTIPAREWNEARDRLMGLRPSDNPVDPRKHPPAIRHFRIQAEGVNDLFVVPTDGTTDGPGVFQIAKPVDFLGANNFYTIGQEVLAMRNVLGGTTVAGLFWQCMTRPTANMTGALDPFPFKYNITIEQQSGAWLPVGDVLAETRGVEFQHAHIDSIHSNAELSFIASRTPPLGQRPGVYGGSSTVDINMKDRFPPPIFSHQGDLSDANRPNGIYNDAPPFFRLLRIVPPPVSKIRVVPFTDILPDDGTLAALEEPYKATESHWGNLANTADGNQTYIFEGRIRVDETWKTDLSFELADALQPGNYELEMLWRQSSDPFSQGRGSIFFKLYGGLDANGLTPGAGPLIAQAAMPAGGIGNVFTQVFVPLVIP